jgi:hypothetical protein
MMVSTEKGGVGVSDMAKGHRHVWTTAAVQGKKSSGLAMWSVAVMCPASKVAVRMTAGHDEVRGSGPDQLAALDAHDDAWVFPIPNVDRLAITSLCSLTHREPVAQPSRP